MARSKNRTVLAVLLMVFVFFMILMLFAAYTVKEFNAESKVFDNLNKKSEIAVIEISGPIMQSRKTVELLHRAEGDKSIKAIILRINSPGGAVGPTQEIYEEVRRIDGAFELKKAKSEGKPIYASFGAIAASGGYYIGAATRRIYSSPGTLTGSIGVIMHFTDLSKLYEFAKVSPYPIKSGKYKDIGSPHRAITEEEKQLMNTMIQGVHHQFIADILRTRKDKIKGELIDLAQGQIYSGESAMKVGLVDQMAGLWAAGRLIHKELGLKSKFGLRYLKSKKKTSIWELVENLNNSITNIKLGTMTNFMPMLTFGN